MSIVEITQVIPGVSLKQMVKTLYKEINGPYEVLNFGPVGKKDSAGKQYKTCFVRLSPKLNPNEVISEVLRRGRFGARRADNAYNLRKKGLRPKNRFEEPVPQILTPDMLLMHTHREILMELQSKYTGLFNLNRRTGNKLIESIAQTVLDRLKAITEKNPEATESGFFLSKFYRRLHPHFGDFQLILSTLHRLQDAAEVPRSQISEQELTVVDTQPYVVDNIPYNIVQQACHKYSDRIVKKVSEHISNLKTDVAQTDGEEDIARKRVREELKNISQYLPLMIKQVISNHFVPQKSPFQRVRIYGEPHLPTKVQMAPFLKKFRPVKIMRSDRMYNVLRFNIPISQYSSLLAMDGTVIGGSKLVIRSSDVPLARVNKLLFGVSEDVEGVADQEMAGEEGAGEERAGEEEMAGEEDWAEDMVL